MNSASAHEQDKITVVSEEEVRLVLSKITKSKYFSHAPKKQKFVHLVGNYYLQGRAGELNEYLIGYEVFEKRKDYNPSTDPVVRVGAHDVRKKLDLYYQNEGIFDSVRMVIPVGTYVPVFQRQVTLPPPVVEDPTSSSEKVAVKEYTSQIEENPSGSRQHIPRTLGTLVSSWITTGERQKQRVLQLSIIILSGVILCLVTIILALIYGGKENFRRKEVEILGWNG